MNCNYKKNYSEMEIRNITVKENEKGAGKEIKIVPSSYYKQEPIINFKSVSTIYKAISYKFKTTEHLFYILV